MTANKKTMESEAALQEMLAKANETLHELLVAALSDELPRGAEQRCIERLARETGPMRMRKPQAMGASGAPPTPGEGTERE